MNVLAECLRLRNELQSANDALMAREYPSLGPDPIRLVVGRKWHKLDIGTSGAFVVHAETGAVHGIKGYGKPHQNVYHGPADQLTGAILLPRRYARAHTPPAA